MTAHDAWFVYVIVNPQGTAYTGIAKDVTARLSAHNGGSGAKATRGKGPWRLIYREGPMPHGAALSREHAIKNDRGFKRSLKQSGAGDGT